MGLLHDFSSKFQYESWFVRINVPSVSNKKSLCLCLSVTLSVICLIILLIILLTPSPSLLPSHLCTTTTNDQCIFPFSYKGVEYSSCSTVDNNGEQWCSTRTDHTGGHVQGSWGQCGDHCSAGCKTVSGPDTDKVCVFPFRWSGIMYRECTSHSNTGQLWCATQVDVNNNYIDNKWGNCGDSCPGCRTTTGGTCHFPFYDSDDENQTQHDECILKGGSLVCPAYKRNCSEDETKCEDSKFTWGMCQPGCAIGCHTYSGLKCVLPFIFNGTEYTDCVQDADPNLTWCATQVEEDGVMVEGSWEYCHNGC